MRNIWKAEFIIADLTYFKPNVLYELGYSHAMNKEAILIYEEKDKETKFPFDSSAIIFSLQEGIKFNISIRYVYRGVK